MTAQDSGHFLKVLEIVFDCSIGGQSLALGGIGAAASGVQASVFTDRLTHRDLTFRSFL